jgi:hypothetical protein
MDTIRTRRIIARLFAILKQHRAERASRSKAPPLLFALPTRTATTTTEPRAVEGSADALNPEALRDGYWLLQRWRGGRDSLDEMIAVYRRNLLRRGWSEPTADVRVCQVRHFVTEALGISERANASSPTALHQKLHRLRDAFDRRK